MTDASMALSLQQYCRDLLKNVVRETDAPAMLFSGGLDTTILMHLAVRRRAMAGITVSVEGRSPDEPFARRAAAALGITHVWLRPTIDELVGVLPQTVKLLRTFDPMTLRNALPVHLGLLLAKEMHFPSVMTGDGADELFAGRAPAFEKSPEELHVLLRRLWKSMTFSARDLGHRLGVPVQTPYLHPLVREFAEKVPAAALVAERSSRRFGKALLRRAFEEEVPEPFLWREKCPAETGAGTAGLTAVLGARVSDEEFSRETDAFLRSDGVHLRDKEHLYYYRLYRAQFGPPVKTVKSPTGVFSRSCPDCGAAVTNPDADFCLLCGASPVP